MKDNIEHIIDSDGLADDPMRDHHISILAGFVPQSSDEDEGRRSYVAFMRNVKQRQYRRKISGIMRYAALICITASVTGLAYHHFNATDCDSAINFVYTPTGQHVGLTLSDGTKVWLNAESSLSYPGRFEKQSRTVKLCGEAYFDICRDDTRPFLVSTSRFDIRACGTRFNVHCYDDSTFYVALEQGSVRVYPSECEVEDGVLLSPGDEAFYTNGSLSVRPCSDLSHSLWRDGIYSFNSEPLRDIFAVLKRYYGMTIISGDTALLSTEYTAKFRHKDGLDEILRQIGKTHKFDVCKEYEKSSIILH